MFSRRLSDPYALRAVTLYRNHLHSTRTHSYQSQKRDTNWARKHQIQLEGQTPHREWLRKLHRCTRGEPPAGKAVKFMHVHVNTDQRPEEKKIDASTRASRLMHAAAPSRKSAASRLHRPPKKLRARRPPQPIPPPPRRATQPPKSTKPPPPRRGAPHAPPSPPAAACSCSHARSIAVSSRATAPSPSKPPRAHISRAASSASPGSPPP